MSNRRELMKFITIAGQLLLLALVFRHYRLESKVFYEEIMLLTVAGFAIHHFLPREQRLRFLVALSLFAIVRIFGAVAGLKLIGAGVGLVAILHLPLSFARRTLMILSAGVVLAFYQLQGQSTVLPVLASLFMFRLVSYLYDLKHQKAPVSVTRSMAYFFLLPNLVFPLFPVVDYQTFCRKHYDGDRYQIYQKGIYWMFQGALQLLLYRYINYNFVIPPEEIASLSDLALYAGSNYGLLMKVAGQFNISIGMLHLFGFNLPRVMHRFYLASSFTDFWRRANVYWKDFMQKVVFYPIHYTLKGYRVRSAMVMTVAPILVATGLTWFFHAYQGFWIRGTFLLSWPDVMFWVVFGAGVTANSVYELKLGRKRVLRKTGWTVRELGVDTLKTTAMFCFVAVMWTLWISPTLADWISIWVAANISVAAILAFVPTLLAIMAAVGLAVLTFEKVELSRWLFSDEQRADRGAFYRPALITATVMFSVLFVGQPEVSGQLGDGTVKLVSDLRSNKLNFRDAAMLEKGYYENLTNVNQFNSQLWEVYMRKPKDWLNLGDTDLVTYAPDFVELRLSPSSSAEFHGELLTVNRWGMRDQDYERTPPANTYRVALLGGSLSMGSGVADSETFEAVLEAMLNRSSGGTPTYEILNFSVSGYGPVRRLATLQHGLSFHPDAVIFVAHGRDYDHAAQLLVTRTREGADIPFPVLRSAVSQAGLTATTPVAEGLRRLEPFRAEITRWVYEETVKMCQQRGVLPVWVLTPSGVGMYEPEHPEKLVELARRAGFVVVDLGDVFSQHPSDDLRVAPWDWHPNAQGHRLIANGIFHSFQELGLAGSRRSTRRE